MLYKAKALLQKKSSVRFPNLFPQMESNGRFARSAYGRSNECIMLDKVSIDIRDN